MTIVSLRGFPARSPFEIARCLARRPGFAALLSGVEGGLGRFSYLASDPVDVVTALDPFCGAPADDASPAPRFIGVVPYEALRSENERPSWSVAEVRPPPLVGAIEWARYDAVLAVDHERQTAEIVADDAAAADRLEARLHAEPPPRSPYRVDLTDDEPGERHLERVREAIVRIYDGEIYQVNLARRVGMAILPPDPLAILSAAEDFLAASPSPFGAVLRTRAGAWILSTSPELLLDAKPNDDGTTFGRIATEPIKGTRRRAADLAADEALRLELEASEKERAELAMIIDVERNDLCRVCVPGSVEIERSAHVVSHRTVHHRVARIVGTVEPRKAREDVLYAVVPSGSVTGAPKVRAMEVIAELEPTRRGLYTGGIGYVGRDGSMRLSMAIRTAVLDEQGRGEYLVGGGIVAESIPEAELEETRWKSTQLAEIADKQARS